MGINNARLGPAVAAGYIDRGFPRKLLKQRDRGQLRKGPCVGDTDKDIDLRILELPGDDVRLFFAFYQNGRIYDRNGTLVRQQDLAADRLGDKPRNILGVFLPAKLPPRVKYRPPKCWSSAGGLQD